MELKEIQHGSAEYAKAVQLRREVLRWPLGLEYTEEQLAAEASVRHFVGECGATGELEILCYALLTEEVPGLARIKQVTVRQDCQGKGLGTEIMLFTEQAAIKSGYERVTLCSRHYAIPFYEKLGYVCTSDWFEEVGMPHKSMLKSL
ncbi:MAG: GNAT family N-acetyltransferase [Armatimonadota bacterium]